jgi:hypothetical protein
MRKYLFIFGFETPAMIDANRKWDSDLEDSNAVFIEAVNERQALEFGRAIANQFFSVMWKSQTPATTVDDYAHWIEEDPESHFDSNSLAKILTLSSTDSEAARNLVDSWIRELSEISG